MKTLKKNNEIKRVKDSSKKDIEILNNLITSGWNYVPKNEWKSLRSEADVKKLENKKKKRGKNV